MLFFWTSRLIKYTCNENLDELYFYKKMFLNISLKGFTAKIFKYTEDKENEELLDLLHNVTKDKIISAEWNIGTIKK